MQRKKIEHALISEKVRRKSIENQCNNLFRQSWISRKLQNKNA